RAGKGDGAVQELGASTTRAHRVVVHCDAGVLRLEAGAPSLGGGLLGRCARTVERSRQVYTSVGGLRGRTGAGIKVRVLIGRGASSKRQSQGRDGHKGAGASRDIHGSSPHYVAWFGTHRTPVTLRLLGYETAG